MEFGNGQQDIITNQTSKAREIRLIDKKATMLWSYQVCSHNNTIAYLWLLLKNNQISILKGPLNLDDMKHYKSKQRDIITSRRCYNVMKTHRTKLRVDMNNKDGFIMH